MDHPDSVEPLWRKAIHFLGLLSPVQENNPIVIYENLESALQDTSRHKEFWSMLSSSQSTSFRIIQEWWNCSTEDEEWFSENQSKAKQIEILNMPHALDHISPLVFSMVFGVGPKIPRISTYRLEIYRLFRMEFDPLEFDNAPMQSTDLTLLRKQRERAAFYATVQRITFPFRTKNTEVARTESLARPSKMSNLTMRPLGPSIDPCHWLKFKTTQAGYPYFLWNTDEKRTVKTEDLPDLPQYICISHTWGRWRDESQPPLTIDGVQWKVPVNTKFRVQDMPDKLAEFFPGTYIWLDLFCIPQDHSALSLSEISRQADIFGNATMAIAWLNDIYHWNGLRETIRWLSEFCLENHTNMNDNLHIPPDLDDQTTGLVLENNPLSNLSNTATSWFTSLWTLQEACLRPDMVLCTRDFEFLTVGHNTVVTLESLAALLNYAIGDYDKSPYETIVNAQKIPESARAGTALEFEELNPPSSGRQRHILDQLPNRSKGILELWDVLVKSGMKDVYRITPASILTLGHYRECTSNRAEAIMSVVGTTDWYKKSVLQKAIAVEGGSMSEGEYAMREREGAATNEEEDLVMGYYPTEFLNEIVCKVEAPFFATVFPDLSILDSVVDISNEAWVPQKSCSAVGSMLPFRSVPIVVKGPPNTHIETPSHEAIRTWRINTDGSVRMRRAGILTSSNHPPISPILANINIPSLFSTGIENQCDLGEWIREFRTDSGYANFAVSLYQPTQKVHIGIILKEVEEHKLIKIGTFITDNCRVEDISSEDVDWVIL